MPAAAETPAFDEAFLKRLEYLHVVARRVFAGRMRGERRSRRIGSGIEFADHRDYAPGDDLRYLDWSVYGRLDRLLIRLFEEEEDLHIYFLVDASLSMAGAKLTTARRVVAALAYIGLANLDRVSIIPFGGAAGAPARPSIPPSRGRGQIFKVLAFLSAVEPAGATDLTAAVSSFLRRSPRRGLVVLVSDFYDPGGYERAITLLGHHRFEPLVIQILDGREARPALLGDVEITDCETGERREVTVTPRLLDALAREHRAFGDRLAAFCAGRGVPSVRADARVPFEDLVLKVLREGGFVG